MIDGWSPHIGDPSLLGWATVISYFLTALLCWRAALGAGDRQEFLFWQLVCILFLALGLNKQLDLQTLFTAVLRSAARSEGWYAGRYPLQIAFVATVALSGVCASLYLARRHRRSSRAIKTAIAGCVFTFCYVIIRAASFHHIDRLLGSAVAGWKLNWLLELGGIGLVAVAAVSARRRPVS